MVAEPATFRVGVTLKVTLKVTKGDGRRLNTKEKDAAKTRTWQGDVREKGTEGRKGKGKAEGNEKEGKRRGR